MSEKPQKILEALKKIKTPAPLKHFETAVENFVKDTAGCGNVEFWWDENPSVKSENLDVDVVYSKEYHLDELICDDKQYEVEAEYETYTIGEGYYTTYIIHSFKPLRVKE